MNYMKVLPCTKSGIHDWKVCPFSHAGEKATRRDPRLFKYSGELCSNVRNGKSCMRGDACPYAHNVFEMWLHPNKYKTKMCTEGKLCRRNVCFFAHDPSELRQPPPKKPCSRGRDKANTKMTPKACPAGGSASAAPAAAVAAAPAAASGAALAAGPVALPQTRSAAPLQLRGMDDPSLGHRASPPSPLETIALVSPSAAQHPLFAAAPRFSRDGCPAPLAGADGTAMYLGLTMATQSAPHAAMAYSFPCTSAPLTGPPAAAAPRPPPAALSGLGALLQEQLLHEQALQELVLQALMHEADATQQTATAAAALEASASVKEATSRAMELAALLSNRSAPWPSAPRPAAALVAAVPPALPLPLGLLAAAPTEVGALAPAQAVVMGGAPGPLLAYGGGAAAAMAQGWSQTPAPGRRSSWHFGEQCY